MDNFRQKRRTPTHYSIGKIAGFLALCLLLPGSLRGAEDIRSADEIIAKLVNRGGAANGAQCDTRFGKCMGLQLGALAAPSIDLPTITFALNSADLTTQAQQQLQEVATALRAAALAADRFEIRGHTDALGSDAYNRELSRQRALAALNYLVYQLGIARERLQSVGFGEGQLLRGVDPAAAANRRVELVNLGTAAAVAPVEQRLAWNQQPAPPVGQRFAPAPRVALVIGNGGYASVPLNNPPNDAALMAQTLRDLGFQVITEREADQRTMKRAIQEFGRRLDAAGRDAVGFFYYAGHGIQANGTNYLIPLGAEIEREADLAIEAVEANWVLAQMAYVGNRLNIVVLDACRNNPYRGTFRGPQRGLAQMDAPPGALVAYATAPGEMATDGDGANSPYAAALAAELRVPGRGVLDVFNAVGIRVVASTGGRQQPWVSASPLPADFRFAAAALTLEHVARDAPPGIGDSGMLLLALISGGGYTAPGATLRSIP